MAQRITIQYATQVFSSQGYRLLSSQYANNLTKMDYVCSNGHKGQMRWSDFQQGHRCPQCYGNKKIAFEEVKSTFVQEGYQLLSHQYINNHSKLKYICPEGHRGQIRWNDFQQGIRCVDCANLRKGKTSSLSAKDVKSAFEEEGYKLLSQYVDACSELKYECPRGHCDVTAWKYWQRGCRCPQCREWTGQRNLGRILKEVFPEHNIVSEDNLGFLGLQRVDYSIRSLSLAFEYDGRQHFEPVTFGRFSVEQAQQNFKKQRERDKKKESMCERHHYILIRIAYTEDLSIKTINERVGEMLCLK